MNLRVLGWALALIVGMLLSACGTLHANLGGLTSMGKVTLSASGVTILRHGAPVAATRGIELQAGDVVETDAHSTAVIEFIDGSATLMPNTKVTVGSIWTWFGRVFFSGPVDSDTAYVNMSVEGTQYLCEVKKDRVVVTGLSGHVRVRSKTGSFAPVAIGARDRFEMSSLKSVGGAQAKRRKISQEEFNSLVAEINAAQGTPANALRSPCGLTNRSGFPDDPELVKDLSHMPAPSSALGRDELDVVCGDVWSAIVEGRHCGGVVVPAFCATCTAAEAPRCTEGYGRGLVMQRCREEALPIFRANYAMCKDFVLCGERLQPKALECTAGRR